MWETPKGKDCLLLTVISIGDPIILAKRELKWEPEIKLEAGLKKTIAYFEDLLKNMQ